MWQKLQCLRHTILVVFQQIPNNLICQNDSPHVIYALDAVSVYFAYIYGQGKTLCTFKVAPYS